MPIARKLVEERTVNDGVMGIIAVAAHLLEKAGSTLEERRDSNSVLEFDCFRIGFAKYAVGVAKFSPGSPPPPKLPKMTQFDNEFVMKMALSREARIFQILGAARLAMNFAPLWRVLHGLKIKVQILVQN